MTGRCVASGAIAPADLVRPLPMTVTSSRGTGVANLATREPKEVWADSDTGAAGIYVDLGGA